MLVGCTAQRSGSDQSKAAVLPAATATPSPTSISLSAPPTQQAVEAVPGLAFEGDHECPAVQKEGQFHLALRGRDVYATLQTVRSPVQHVAPARPAVLCTVPKGFRPAVPMTWKVNGQLVWTEGKPDPGRREVQVLGMNVGPDGRCVDWMKRAPEAWDIPGPTPLWPGP